MLFWHECVPGSVWDTPDTKEMFVNNQLSESHLAPWPAVSHGTWWEGLDKPPVPLPKPAWGIRKTRGQSRHEAVGSPDPRACEPRVL